LINTIIAMIAKTTTPATIGMTTWSLVFFDPTVSDVAVAVPDDEDVVVGDVVVLVGS
jgi:hypothetical protein